jgi:hypothetical protein
VTNAYVKALLDIMLMEESTKYIVEYEVSIKKNKD